MANYKKGQQRVWCGGLEASFSFGLCESASDLLQMHTTKQVTEELLDK